MDDRYDRHAHLDHAEDDAFVEAIGGRVAALRATLARAEVDAAEVLEARRELRAEAEARDAARQGRDGA